MKIMTVVGNLGADAELRKDQGNPFVSMSIADTSRRTLDDGTIKETTTWISATWNSDGGKLLQYLKKGTTVCVVGECDVRTFHSEREHRLKAGINLYVRQISLIGGKPDSVPSSLYDKDGFEHKVTKFYHTETIKNSVLFDRSGLQYNVEANGWIFPVQANIQPTETKDAGGTSDNGTTQLDSEE